jgi:hypothetical protein
MATRIKIENLSWVNDMLSQVSDQISIHETLSSLILRIDECICDEVKMRVE